MILEFRALLFNFFLVSFVTFLPTCLPKDQQPGFTLAVYLEALAPSQPKRKAAPRPRNAAAWLRRPRQNQGNSFSTAKHRTLKSKFLFGCLAGGLAEARL